MIYNYTKIPYNPIIKLIHSFPCFGSLNFESFICIPGCEEVLIDIQHVGENNQI